MLGYPANPNRRRGGFSLTEVLFAIFILGTGLAMTAMMFPLAVSLNRASFADTLGNIICKNALELGETLAKADHFPGGQMIVLAGGDSDAFASQTILGVNDQHYPMGAVGSSYGFVLTGRRVDRDNNPRTDEGFELLAISYIKSDPRNLVYLQVIEKFEEKTGTYGPKPAPGNPLAGIPAELYCTPRSPVIFADGQWAIVISNPTRGTVTFDRPVTVTTVVDGKKQPIKAYLLVEERRPPDPKAPSPYLPSPSLSVLATRAWLR